MLRCMWFKIKVFLLLHSGLYCPELQETHPTSAPSPSSPTPLSQVHLSTVKFHKLPCGCVYIVNTFKIVLFTYNFSLSESTKPTLGVHSLPISFFRNWIIPTDPHSTASFCPSPHVQSFHCSNRVCSSQPALQYVSIIL